ncbi:DUF4268 domain-containing protein [Campylobacter sp. JMF_02 ED1]|uniref:DUF4268 domain-containing protein n=1 Tax=unclassified Campylobacter TaxID=2593542 RepID=UPI0022E9BF8D|nr:MULTISPECIES: DUF4268 domain-containing protein [unclassified Campylobacter]MDA3049378.1 DUF4268 domain-containing protein [Campylobacter sp. JMF_15 NE4]MDA3051194.1 DUF4268 domain-containing protein [Campylobacter sp. JMF_02 ED1]
MKNLGKLEEIKDLREIWKHEEKDFSQWLANKEENNIELLGNALGIEIEVEERESKIGNFELDILAKEINTDRKIIIENQLTETDHKHLGQIITYAAGKSADIIIWIVKKARDEHKAAITWLNEHTDKNIGFFLCEIKLYKIGSSDPAVKFEVIEQPNDWSKIMKEQDNTITPTEQERYDFWDKFNEFAFNGTNKEFEKEFNKRSPSKDHWLNYAIGSSEYNLAIEQIRLKPQQIRVRFHIRDNKEIFANLYNKKDEIEQETGFKFDWQELPQKKASGIVVTKKINFNDKDQADTFNWIMQVMLKIKKSFLKYV